MVLRGRDGGISSEARERSKATIGGAASWAQHPSTGPGVSSAGAPAHDYGE